MIVDAPVEHVLRIATAWPDAILGLQLLLRPHELEALTGYSQPSRQLIELHRQGFWRARRLPVTGALVLERDHYSAVCAGIGVADKHARPRPKLMSA